MAVAIPVHNGAADLERCLDCLQRQSLKAFRAIIFENGSTDATLEIAQRYARSDPRFEIRRSEQLLPVLENFHRATTEAAGLAKYFCLRAADDHTSDNFLEVLVNALEAEPTKHLAVGSVIKFNACGQHDDSPARRVERILDRSRTGNWLVKFPASWFYGVYRSGPAIDYLLSSGTIFPHPWGCDRLVIYKMLSDLGVVYRADAVFFCQTGSGGAKKYKARAIAEALRRRRTYYRACMDMTAHRHAGALVSRWIAWRVAGEHTATSLRHLAEITLKRLSPL